MTDQKTSKKHKLLRDPLIHFFAVGALIYLAYFFVAEPETGLDDNTIIITASEIEWLASAWQKRWNRPPTQQELDGLVEQQVRETALYREALEMGLDKNDIVIRRRLAQKVEFLTQDLLQPPAPDQEQLTAYFKENKQKYAKEPRITFSQVFFNPDQRGDNTLKDAEATKTILSKLPEAPENIDEYGDAFLLQSFYSDKSISEIARQFGNGFAVPLVDLEEGVWSGPVLSGYGTHLVYVHKLVASNLPDLDAVRERVTADWTDQKRQEINQEFLARLMASYTIVVEPAPNVQITAGGS